MQLKTYIHSSKSYHYQNLTVCIFRDNKHLNTNELTLIDEIDDIHDINLSSPTLEENLITESVLELISKKLLMVCL